MNKKSLYTALIILVIIVIAGIVYFFVTKKNETPPENGVSFGDVVSQQSVSWNGNTYTFVHYCKGTIKQAEVEGAKFNPALYCIGENQLVFIGSDNNQLKLADQNITTESEAPLLMSVTKIASSIVLIEYSAEPCSTTNDCGVGMPHRYITGEFNLADKSYRDLKNYPQYGTEIWNKSETKVVLLPNTCGGAGCGEDPLVGYNLSSDEAKNITAEGAAEEPNATDVIGNKIPYWSNLNWIDNNNIVATINYPNGTKKEIKASF